MGKGSQAKLAKEQKEQRRALREAEALAKHKKEKTAIIIAAISFVLVVAIILTGFFVRQNQLKTGSYARNKVLFSNGDFQVTGTEMSYFAYEAWQDFCDENGDVSYYGIDVEQPIYKQVNESGIPWSRQFIEEAQDAVITYLKLAKCAADEKIALTSEELAKIDTAAAEVELEKVGMGITLDDVKNAMKLHALADKYKEFKRENLVVTSDEINAEYNKNPDAYDVFSSTSHSLEINGELTADKAKEAAELILKEDLATAESFAAAVNKVLGSMGIESNVTEENVKVFDNGSVDSLTDVAKDWVKGQTTGASTTFVNDEQIDIVYLVSGPHPKEDWEKDVERDLKDRKYADWLDSLPNIGKASVISDYESLIKF